MKFTFVGAGAVGGYYGAMLSRNGEEVSFVARGAHLDAIRRNGLRIESEAVGDFTAHVAADDDPKRLGPADVVVFAVKTYDNDTAIPLIAPLVGPKTTVLTLQNGVDSGEQVAAAVGERATIAGATYIATAIEAPGLIRQTGTHRRIVFGELFGAGSEPSARVRAIETTLKAANIHAEAVADAKPILWEKFVYLAPFASFTGAARLPIGPLWAEEDCRTAFLQAVEEVATVARASGVTVPSNRGEMIAKYIAGIPPTTRSSLLIDLSHGKKIEVESLTGSVVRRGRAVGVPTPMMAALYAVLKPHRTPVSSS